MLSGRVRQHLMQKPQYVTLCIDIQYRSGCYHANNAAEQTADNSARMDHLGREHRESRAHCSHRTKCLCRKRGTLRQQFALTFGRADTGTPNLAAPFSPTTPGTEWPLDVTSGTCDGASR